MKLNCGLTWDEAFEEVWKEKLRRIEADTWQSWFAWRPVRVGKRDCRWLERIERRYTGWGITSFPWLRVVGYDPEYRIKGTDGA